MSAGYDRDRTGSRNVRSRETSRLRPFSHDGSLQGFFDVIVMVEDRRNSRRGRARNHRYTKDQLASHIDESDVLISVEHSAVSEPNTCRQFLQSIKVK